MLSARTICEEVFRRRLDALPAETRRLLLLKAAQRLERLDADLLAIPELRWLSLAFGSAVRIWDDKGFAMLASIRCWNCGRTIAGPHGRSA